MGSISIEMVFAVVAFIAGMLFMGSRRKGGLKELFKREEETTNDQSKYNSARLRLRLLRLRQERARREAEVRDSHSSGNSDGDPVDDLRIKLDSYRRAGPGGDAP